MRIQLSKKGKIKTKTLKKPSKKSSPKPSKHQKDLQTQAHPQQTIKSIDLVSGLKNKAIVPNQAATIKTQRDNLDLDETESQFTTRKLFDSTN